MDYVDGEPINAYCDTNALSTTERLRSSSARYARR